MQSQGYKNFARLCSLTCGVAALKLAYDHFYLLGAVLLLIGVFWFASTVSRAHH